MRATRVRRTVAALLAASLAALGLALSPLGATFADGPGLKPPVVGAQLVDMYAEVLPGTLPYTVDVVATVADLDCASLIDPDTGLPTSAELHWMMWAPSGANSNKVDLCGAGSAPTTGTAWITPKPTAYQSPQFDAWDFIGVPMAVADLDPLDGDSDGDGCIDLLDTAGTAVLDLDGDCNADAFDADGDGEPDLDTNGDGFVDGDENADGIADADENGDGYIDLDGNGDGQIDADTNGDGIVDLDLDEDGTIDTDEDLNSLIDSSEDAAPVQRPFTGRKVRINRPMFGDDWAPLNPDDEVKLTGEVRYASPGGAHNNSQAQTGASYSFRAPATPVWIGIGDGYTTALKQDAASCVVAAGCVNFEDGPRVGPGGDTHSWVDNATQRRDAQMSQLHGDLPEFWETDAIVVSTDAFNEAGELNASHPDVVAMKQLLASRAADPARKKPGSWNWVGLSAGLADSGILDAIDAWYRRPANGTVTGGVITSLTSTLPWDVDTVDECPTYTGVPTQVAQRAAAMDAGIASVIAEALDADPTVRVVQLLYPHLVETTNVCRPAAEAAINALNAAVNVDATEGNVLTAEQQAASFSIDLATGWDPFPTGNIVDDGTTREHFGSPLQLKKIFGYPFPDATGSAKVASQIVELVGDQQDNLPPQLSVRTEPVATVPGTSWFKSPLVTVFWGASDPDDLLWTPDYEPTDVLPTEGKFRPRSPSEATEPADWAALCDDGGLCPEGADKDVWIDRTPPLVGTQLTGDTISAHGWYNGAVDVTMTLGLDDTANVDPAGILEGETPSMSVSGIPTTPQPPQTYGFGTQGTHVARNVVGTFCDVATNCATVEVPVNIDLTLPTVTAQVTSPVSPGEQGWYRDDVHVTFAASDDLSGLATPAGQIEGFTTEGTAVATFSATDKADNVETLSVPVKIDKTAPVVTFGGVTDGAVYDVESVPTVTCSVTDALSGPSSNSDPCVLSAPLRTPIVEGGVTVGYTVTHTVTGSDKAGNTTTASVTYRVEGIIDVEPPVVTVAPDRAANDKGWYNDTVHLVWSFESDGEPSTGFDPDQHHTTDVDGPVEDLVVTNPDGSMCDFAGNCGFASIELDIDPIDPVVTPHVVGVLGNNGWYTSVVGIAWTAADEGGSGLDGPSVLTPSVLLTNGTHTETRTAVDNADNEGSTTKVVKIDYKAPTVKVNGPVAGTLYTTQNPPPAPTCTASDQHSGLAGACTVTSTSVPLPSYYPTGSTKVTYKAVATDNAGNTSKDEVTVSVLATPIGIGSSGRMTVGGGFSGVSTSGTLRCNGSPNELQVVGGGSSFNLTTVDRISCWDEVGYDEGQPNAPMDSLYLEGRGTRNGQVVRIQAFFTDRGEPGTGDTGWVRITSLDGATQYVDAGGFLASGNFQAHEAQGNGTNDNGNVNGPTGNTSNGGGKKK